MIFVATILVRSICAFVPAISDELPDSYLRAVQYADAANNVLQGNGIKLDRVKVDKIFLDWGATERRLPPPYTNYKDSQSPQYDGFWDEKGYLMLTIGLAKLTGQIRYENVIYLQILLSGLASLLFANAVFRFTGVTSWAVSSGLIYSIHPVEIVLAISPDHPIWPVYAAVVALAALTFQWSSWPRGRAFFIAFLVGTFIGYCVVTRATVIAIAGTLVLAFVLLRKFNFVTTIFLVLGLTFSIVASRFVLPDTPTVGRSIFYHTLLAGVSEFGAIEGLEWDDESINNYITKRYDVLPNTPEFDEAFKLEYHKLLEANPWLPISVPLKRFATFVVAWQPGRNIAPIVIILAAFKIAVVIGAIFAWKVVRRHNQLQPALCGSLIVFTPVLFHTLIVPLNIVYTAPSLILITPLAWIAVLSILQLMRSKENDHQPP